MLIQNEAVTRKIVIILATILGAIFTITAVIAFFLSSDKKPFYVMFPVIFLFDITWVLVYIFYLSKNKNGKKNVSYNLELNGKEMKYVFFRKKECPVCGSKMKRQHQIKRDILESSSTKSNKFFSEKNYKANLSYNCTKCRKTFSIQQLVKGN